MTVLLPARRCMAAVSVGATILLAACGSTPTAAPVIERSPNAGPLEQARPAPPAAVQPAAKTPASLPPATLPANAPVGAAPAVLSEKPERQPLPIPVDEPATKPYREGDWRPEYHIVRKGDTLYSIALDYGQDYRELAAWNNLVDPGLIKIDQRLRLFPPDSVGEATIAPPTPLAAVAAAPQFSEPKARKLPYSEQALVELKMPAPSPAPAAISPATVPGKPSAKAPAVAAAVPPGPKESAASDGKMIWEWPAQGKLLYGFGQGPNQKGVGIEGRIGQPVLAAGPGKVVYSGSGLRGYGKLIIIKHNASYLSVYAHNSQILVKEGQTVAKGQKIGEIGDTDSDRIALHFEIRRLGKPIDPLQYLPARNS